MSEKKKSWDDLVFAAIEKLAAAPSKLKDPKESVGQAVEWIKSVRDDIQAKIAEELPAKLSQMDWDSVSEKVVSQIAENYELKIEMKIKFEPKPQVESKSDKKDH